MEPVESVPSVATLATLATLAESSAGQRGGAAGRQTRRAVVAAAVTLGAGASLPLLAACGGTAAPTEGTGQASEAPTKVVFATVFASGEPWDRYQRFWDAFNQEQKA